MADNFNEEPMPASATRTLMLWASGFGAGAVVVLLLGALLVNMGTWGYYASTPATPTIQSAANAPAQPAPSPQASPAAAGAQAPQTTGQAPAPQQH